MNFFDFLTSHAKVETIVSLLAFIVAAFLGYLAQRSSVKLKYIGQIIEKADSQSKAELATSLAGVLPSYKIPELSQKDGYKVVKLQLEQRSDEFRTRMKLLRLGMILFFAVVIVLMLKNYMSFASTSGDQSPIIRGDSVHIEYHNNFPKDSVR